MNKSKLITLALVLTLPCFLLGQKFQDEKISQEGKVELIDEFSSLLEEKYLYEDTARLMRKLMQSNLENGTYENIKMARSFVSALTNDLRENFQDRHIAIRYNPQMAKALNSGENGDGGITEEVIQEQLAIEIYENYRIPQVRRFNGNIGYLRIDQMLPPELATGYSEKVAAAVELIADTDAVILDLRENGGGYVEGVHLILSYFFEPDTHTSSSFARTADGMVTGEEYTSDRNIEGRTLRNHPVYVLVGPRTGSGAEAIAHAIKYAGRGVLIGDRTFGAGYIFDSHPVGKNFIASIPYATGMHPNATENWESVGVKPDFEINLKEALQLARELAVKELLQGERSKPEKQQYEYRLESLEWEYNRLLDLKKNYELSKEVANTYIGEYGFRKISMEGNTLFYQRTNPDRPIRRLIPVGSDEFLIEGLDAYRLKFVRAKKSDTFESIRFYSVNRLFIDPKSD